MVVHKLWQQTAILNLSEILDGNSNRRKLWTYFAHFMKTVTAALYEGRIIKDTVMIAADTQQ